MQTGVRKLKLHQVNSILHTAEDSLVSLCLSILLGLSSTQMPIQAVTRTHVKKSLLWNTLVYCEMIFHDFLVLTYP